MNQFKSCLKPVFVYCKNVSIKDVFAFYSHHVDAAQIPDVAQTKEKGEWDQQNFWATLADS